MKIFNLVAVALGGGFLLGYGVELALQVLPLLIGIIVLYGCLYFAPRRESQTPRSSRSPARVNLLESR